jgi:hypothetical protein
MCSNAAHGEVTSIKYYVIKFVSDLRQVGGFLFTDINLDIPTLNIKLSFWMFATSKEMAKIVTKQQNDLIFGRKKLFVNQR